MGWELVIARRDGNLDHPTWRAYAERAGDFRFEAERSVTNPRTGDVMTVSGPFEVWTGHPDGTDRWFMFSGGTIRATRPDAPTIARMREAAADLGAEVLTEDLEPYV